jgi:hypothetical protein
VAPQGPQASVWLSVWPGEQVAAVLQVPQDPHAPHEQPSALQVRLRVREPSPQAPHDSDCCSVAKGVQTADPPGLQPLQLPHGPQPHPSALQVRVRRSMPHAEQARSSSSV